jgi:hypothetical protein
MRRRFWSACRQSDLMISFQLGLPSNICLENCDTQPPRNLLDSDFDSDTQSLPRSRSENEATRLLWFIVKDRLMTTFGKICRAALSFKEKSAGASQTEIDQLDREIRQMHQTVPDVLRPRPLCDSIADAPFLIMTRLYIEFIYLKSLLVLHRRHLSMSEHPSKTNTSTSTSTHICIDAATRLVRHFVAMYAEFAPGGQLYTERWMLTNFTMNDFLLAVMVLCLVLHTRWKPTSLSVDTIDAVTETEVRALLEQAHRICVDKAPASRDAWRVSHAVRLILKGTKPIPAACHTLRAPHVGVQSTNGAVQQLAMIDTATSTSPTPLQSAMGEQAMTTSDATFGLLDPFNPSFNSIFNDLDLGVGLDPELESVDWMNLTFDPRIR